MAQGFYANYNYDDDSKYSKYVTKENNMNVEQVHLKDSL